MSEAPTVTAPAALAGEKLQASAFALPAWTEVNTPELIIVVTALLSEEEKLVLSDMLATAGGIWLAATQFTPPMIPAIVPEPLQSSTRTESSQTPFATPYCLPPTIPAT